MSEVNSRLFKLGEIIAKEHKDILRKEDIVNSAEHLLLAHLTKTGKINRSIIGMGLTVAAAAVAALVFVFWPGAMNVTVNGAPAETMRWFQSEPNSDHAFSFSDGSTVLLKNKGRLRIREITAKGAVVELERGRITASIKTYPSGEWIFEVGPFTIAVMGTRFDAAWNAQNQKFDLNLHEGSVEITGPTLPRTKKLIAGQNMDISLAPVSTRKIADNSSQTKIDSEEKTQKELDKNINAVSHHHLDIKSSPSNKHRIKTRVGLTKAPEEPNWKTLASQGHYARALEASENIGFKQMCQHLSATDVLTLGNVARYAQKPALAKLAYMTVRQRFPGREQATTAAFSLGLLAFPGAGAIRWFDTSLKEMPGGSLAREAMGRLLEVCHRTGRTEKSMQLARQYLVRFPDGPHAAMAKSITLR